VVSNADEVDEEREERFARSIAERLGPRLGGRVTPETIEEHARAAYRTLAQDARILDFIPILSERDVYLSLRSP